MYVGVINSLQFFLFFRIIISWKKWLLSTLTLPRVPYFLCVYIKPMLFTLFLLSQKKNSSKLCSFLIPVFFIIGDLPLKFGSPFVLESSIVVSFSFFRFYFLLSIFEFACLVVWLFISLFCFFRFCSTMVRFRCFFFWYVFVNKFLPWFGGFWSKIGVISVVSVGVWMFSAFVLDVLQEIDLQA